MGIDHRHGLVLVHGGAGGWPRWPDRLIEAVDACARAAAAGRDALAGGGSALDAVEAAVCELEDAPSLNAGRGSHPKSNGIVEMDAMLMDGASLALGAVAAIVRVRHPVSLARRVMEETPHTLLAGEGASAFADAIGFPRCTNDDLIVQREESPLGEGTVGAVAIDPQGNLASATSTGGVRKQMPGRVGDVPLAGSGGYADNASAAVSATGDGEAIMKLVLSKRVCDLVAGRMPVQEAVEDAIALLGARLRATGGLIAIDREGLPAVAFNSDALPWAFASIDGRASAGSGRWGAGTAS
jgi:beta-aspartyl-peptidase (threonine type)